LICLFSYQALQSNAFGQWLQIRSRRIINHWARRSSLFDFAGAIGGCKIKIFSFRFAHSKLLVFANAYADAKTQMGPT